MYINQKWTHSNTHTQKKNLSSHFEGLRLVTYFGHFIFVYVDEMVLGCVREKAISWLLQSGVQENQSDEDWGADYDDMPKRELILRRYSASFQVRPCLFLLPYLFFFKLYFRW